MHVNATLFLYIEKTFLLLELNVGGVARLIALHSGSSVWTPQQ